MKGFLHMDQINYLFKTYPKASKAFALLGVWCLLLMTVGYIAMVLFDPTLWIGAFVAAYLFRESSNTRQLIWALVGALLPSIFFILVNEPRHPQLFGRFLISIVIAYFSTGILNSYFSRKPDNSRQGAQNAVSPKVSAEPLPSKPDLVSPVNAPHLAEHGEEPQYEDQEELDQNPLKINTPSITSAANTAGSSYVHYEQNKYDDTSTVTSIPEIMPTREFGWIERILLNGRVHICAGKLHLALSHCEPIKKAKIWAVAAVMQETLFGTGKMFQNAHNDFIDYSKHDAKNIYEFLENIRNEKRAELKNLKIGLEKYGGTLPSYVDDEVEIDRRALEIWMVIFGTRLISDGQSKLEFIGNFADEAEPNLNNAIQELCNNEAISAAEAGFPEAEFRTNNMDIDHWIALCGFRPSFLKQPKIRSALSVDEASIKKILQASKEKLNVIWKLVISPHPYFQNVKENIKKGKSDRIERDLKPEQHKSKEILNTSQRYINPNNIAKTLFIEKMKEALAAHSKVTPTSSSDKDIVACNTAFHIMRQVLNKTAWNQENLNDDQEFALLIIGFAVCDAISQSSGVDFELMTAGVSMKLTSVDRIGNVDLGEVGNAYNQFASSDDGEIITNASRLALAWIAEPKEMEPVVNLSQILLILAKAVE